MSDAHKHPADPANELASDNSAIDPRDFRNALGHIRHRRHHRHGDGGGRQALRADLQLLCLGVAEPAAGAVEPRHVFAGLDDLPERQPFHGQCARRVAASAGACNSRNRRTTNSPASNGSRASATRPSSPAASASFQCRAANRYYGGDHVIFLGAVEAYAYNRQEPLLFARGGFGRFTSGDGK